ERSDTRAGHDLRDRDGPGERARRPLAVPGRTALRRAALQSEEFEGLPNLTLCLDRPRPRPPRHAHARSRAGTRGLPGLCITPFVRLFPPRADEETRLFLHVRALIGDGPPI